GRLVDEPPGLAEGHDVFHVRGGHGGSGYWRSVAVLPSIRDDRGVNPTAGLLWEAARPAVRPDEVAALIASGADIDQASTLALGHGLGPLLVRALGTVGHLAAPAARADADMCRAQSRVVLLRAVALATEPLIGA